MYPIRRLAPLLALLFVGAAVAQDLDIVAATLIDGTGAEARPGMTVSVRDGRIVSIGERALFQFVERGREPGRPPVRTQWLDDGSLQAFAGPRWKDDLLHRVQRVDDRTGVELPPSIDGFRTRRVNLTFRYVPDRDVVPFARLAPEAREDVRDYVQELAKHSTHFQRALRS